MSSRFAIRSAGLALSAALALGACVQQQTPMSAYGQGNGPYAAPRSQPMDAARAFGLWKSNFGAVKVEADARGAGQVQGVWMYQRNGTDVIGYFAGALDGNVLRFTWQEPGDGAPLVGEGFLVFDPGGQRFDGRWWTTARDRMGEWNGWRPPAPPPMPGGEGGAGYGGAGYGDPYAPTAYPPTTTYPPSY